MKLLLLYFVVCIAYIDCKGGGRGGGGRGGGGRSGGGGIFKGIFGWGKSSGSQSHTYPASSGYSGHGSGGSHGYPSSNGLSGNQRGMKYGQRYGSYNSYVPRVPSYYTAPQYVYVNQYRSSNSRFNSLLIGLTMYNMGRSHVYHDHYYRDSYYRRSSSSSTSSSLDDGSSSTSTDANESKDEANCLMRIKEDEKEEVLKIPCAIVTTFADGNRKAPDTSEQASTECVNMSVDKSAGFESTEGDSVVTSSITIDKDSSENQMICKSTVKSIDPLAVTGPPLNTISMICTIEIWTSKEVISNDVECKTLLRYAKMPVPEKKDAIIMPPRSELKEMLENPPWWLALFLAV